MIAALIALKRKAPWLWHRVEDVNGLLFSVRYRRLPQLAADVLAGVQVADYRFSLLGKEDLPALEDKAVKMLKNGEKEEAVKLLNNYTSDFAGATRQTWQELEHKFWEMFWTGF